MKTNKAMSNMFTDQLLLELIRENDDRAFTILYNKYWQLLLNFASHYLSDKATCEEITQELFIQLHKRRYTIRINSSVSSYLYTALRNKILNHIRNQAVYRKHIHLAANKAARLQNNVDQFINMRELQAGISCSLKCMPAKCKEVYLLHDQDDLTIKKISQVLSRPVDTVEKQLRRAKKHLRSSLLPYNHYALWKNKAQIVKQSTAISTE